MKRRWWISRMLGTLKGINNYNYLLLLNQQTILPCSDEKCTDGGMELSNDFSLNEAEAQCFHVQFLTMNDKYKVLQEGPWHFDKNLIAFSDGAIGSQVHGMIPHKVDSWLRLCSLPLNRRDKVSIERIGNRIGSVIRVEAGDGFSWSKYARVWVSVDVSKPLTRGIFVLDGNGDKVWVFCRYERLPNYCYICGIVDHLEADCDLSSAGSISENWQYSPFMRSTPGKPKLFNRHSSAFKSSASSNESTGSGGFSSTGRGVDEVRRQLFHEQAKGVNQGAEIVGTGSTSSSGTTNGMTELLNQSVEGGQLKKVLPGKHDTLVTLKVGTSQTGITRKTKVAASGTVGRESEIHLGCKNLVSLAGNELLGSAITNQATNQVIIQSSTTFGCFHSGISEAQEGKGKSVYKFAPKRGGRKAKIMKRDKAKNPKIIKLSNQLTEVSVDGATSSLLENSKTNGVMKMRRW